MDILKYLQDCLFRALQEESFEYNKSDENNLHFIRYSIDVAFFICFDINFYLDCSKFLFFGVV